MFSIDKLARELLNATNRFRYEVSDSFVEFTAQKLRLYGGFSAWVNDGPRSVSSNVVTNEGILTALGILFHAGTPISSWYIAPFSSTSTPTGTITGATFTSALTEFTAYSQSTRVVWATDAASGTSITNTTTPATFTINADNSDVYGAGLLSTSAKSDTTGKLYAAAQFSAPKLDMATNDQLFVTYSAGLTSA